MTSPLRVALPVDSDDETAWQMGVQAVDILGPKGDTLDAESIKSWAIRARWIPTAADELAKLAGRVAALKTKPSISSTRAGQSRYDVWSA